MSNYPPGVTASMIEEHFGGEEDEGITVPLFDNYSSLEMKAVGYEFYFALLNSDDKVVDEFFMSDESATELMLAIKERL